MSRELSYAVRPRVVARQLGLLLLVVAVLGLVPGVVSLVLGDLDAAWRYGVAVVVLGVVGGLLCRLRGLRRIQSNEAMVVVAGMFVVSPLVMSLPMTASGLGWGDAMFEAVSGVTTTGLSVAGAASERPASFLFGRSWMQWYGGLGIVVLSLALVLQGGTLRRRLAETEAIDEEDHLGSARWYARRVLVIYLVLTAAGIAGLMATGVGPLDAASYTFAGVSTGGFSPRDGSLGGISWAGRWVVIATCLLGAVSFAFYVRVLRQGPRAVWRDRQAGGVVVMSVLATLALAACFRLADGMAWGDAALHAPLMALSAQSTSGFSSVDVSGLDATSKVVMIVSMAVGGEAGSTAGGFKILRLLIVLRMVQALVIRSAMPRHAVMTVSLGGRKLGDEEVREALLIVLLFVMVMVVSWVPFVAMGYDPLDSLFEVVSATGTVGLSAGLCGPELPAGLKGVLCADMLLGRLEILAWLVFLRPGTWIGKRGGES